jgi:galactose-1-phosphate uridylyltransferase
VLTKSSQLFLLAIFPDASLGAELGSGMLFAVPIPEEFAASGEAIEAAIQAAVEEARFRKSFSFFSFLFFFKLLHKNTYTHTHTHMHAHAHTHTHKTVVGFCAARKALQLCIYE